MSSTIPTSGCTIGGAARDRLLASGKRIYVTGSSGWLGRCLLEALHTLFGAQRFAAQVRAISSAGGVVMLRDGTRVPTLPLADLAAHRDNDSLMCHFAYLTKEKALRMSLDDYVAANRHITRQVMDALDGLGCTGLFVPSSGAVYRPFVAEPELTPVNAYGRLKLEDEALARGWAEAVPGRSAVVCRVFNVSGPYINKYSDYALASAIECTLQDRPVAIRTALTTLRSFVATDELLSLALALMLGPLPYIGTFDTAGEQTLELDEMVGIVQQTLGHATPLQRPPRSDVEDRYLGQRAPYAALLAQCGLPSVPLAEQILQTADYIRQFPQGANTAKAALK
jgi:UDP-glucuronate decarboxylase